MTPSEWDVELIDEEHDTVDFDGEYALVAVTANTQQAERAYEIGRQFARRGVTAVLGGIHATVLPEEAGRHFRSVAVGEGENTWPEILRDVRSGGLRPVYRSQGPVDLATVPAARYDLLHPERYNLAWVQATRGCPHDCSFCVASSVFGRKVRYRPIDHVLQDVESIKRVWKHPNVSFADDNLIINRKYSLDLFRELKGLDVRYFLQTDISVAEDDELLRMLKDGGCSMVFIGFETILDPALRQIDRHGFKHRYVHRYPSLIQKIQSMGIGVFGAFIVGFDEETPESIKRLGDFICDNRLYASQITILTPYPGCRVRSDLEAQDRLLDLDWSHYNCTEVTFVPQNFAPSELQQAYNRLHEKVYSAEELQKTARYFIERFKSR
ncbi:MAG: radical SAM protein [Spirochaetales bacterium]|nr:radical SAM protein [Spirochaetales bacterium]